MNKINCTILRNLLILAICQIFQVQSHNIIVHYQNKGYNLAKDNGGIVIMAKLLKVYQVAGSI